MTVGFVRRFVDELDRSATHHGGLTRAVEALEAERASEFSRCMSAFCLDAATALKALDLPRWKILPDDEMPLSTAVISRARYFLGVEQERELSTALLAQLLLRAHAQALGQVRLALSSVAILPAPLVVRDVAEVARRVTAGVALCYGLPVDRTTVDDPGEVEPGRPPPYFEEDLGASIRYWAEMPAEIRGSDLLGSASLVRLACGRGADQRIGCWLQAIGLNMIDFARVAVDEEPAGVEIAGVPATREAVAVWNAARWLGALSGQVLSTDRLILASLATPSSHLAAHLAGLFGHAVNLPLLYLRTALPPGVSLPEAGWLIGRGDANTRPGPSGACGDLCLTRVLRLLEESAQQPGFDARARLAAFLEHNQPNADFHQPGEAFSTGDSRGVLELLRDAARARPEKTTTYARLLEDARPAARRPDGSEYWSHERYRALVASDLSAAYLARRQLAACQSGPIGLRTLARFGPSSAWIGELVEHEPLLALDAVGVAHCLASGIHPYPPYPIGDTVRLVIGGENGRYVLGVVTRESRYQRRFELSEREALAMWREMRRPAKAGAWGAVADAMRGAAERIGIDRVSALLQDADVEFTAVHPFDGLVLDQLIRSVAGPRSVIHRVFGARAGTWAGDFARLRRAGGTPLVIDDPTASLTAAKLEAVSVSDMLGATRVGGADVSRASILRMLEAAQVRPPLVHFTGHGVSGLVGPSGEITSGVLAADREALGIASIASAGMPRVLIASACDVGSTPPQSRASAWSTSAIAHGASYSLAAGLPVYDTSALVFMVLLTNRWQRGMRLEWAVASIARLGRDPARLLASWLDFTRDPALRRAGRDWIRERSASEISHGMGAFCLSTA